MEFLNLEQIREFPKPLDADEELKNNYIIVKPKYYMAKYWLEAMFMRVKKE